MKPLGLHLLRQQSRAFPSPFLPSQIVTGNIRSLHSYSYHSEAWNECK